MKRFVAIGALLLACGELAAVGCNAILGNEPGMLGTDASITSSACPPDKKNCSACVPLDDPKLGCGGVCNVCPTPQNGTAGCALQNGTETCDLASCNTQFDNCDNDPANGCETHTTVRAHCGSCGIDCQGQFCERQGNGYDCSATCDAPNLTCGPDGGECVDPNTDNTNCGGCDISCIVSNGTGTCSNGTCEITCQPGYFHCGNQCVAPTDQQCGTQCTDCGPSAHCQVNPVDPTQASCVANTCSPGGAGCGGGTPICCGGSCFAEGANACGPNCHHCNGSGAACSNDECGCTSGSSTTCHIGGEYWCCALGTNCSTTNAGTCDTPVVCNPPYNCSITTGGCGCNTSGSCTAPDFSHDPNCGACAVKCADGGAVCSPLTLPDGGPWYGCQVFDAGPLDSGSSLDAGLGDGG